MTALTHARVLVLNRSYKPVAVTDVGRAFGLLYKGIVKAVDREFQTFDYESWAALAADLGDDTVSTSHRVLKVPRVVVLQAFDKLPRTKVRFSRQNIYVRDNFTCQYCGKHFPRRDLNLDHVVPKSQGGRTTWDNIVCSCVKCNTTKSGRTPAEAGMRLLKKPSRPPVTSLAPPPKTKRAMYEEWLPFIDPVDASYWHTELSDDE